MKLRNKAGRVILLLIMAFVVGPATAQEYLGEATFTVDGPKGFYRIQLTPSLTRWLKPDCSNVRIYDKSGKEIQYMMDEAQRIYSSAFVPYPIISNTQTAGCCTSLIFENDSKQKLDYLSMRIRNAQVNKRGTLAGSDDRVHWYALKGEFFIGNIDNGQETSEVRMLDLPLSDYKYYRLDIGDSTSPPLNIIEVGYLKDFVTSESYLPVDDVKITVADSSRTKQTYCYISFDAPQWVDQISFSVSNSPFYKRNVSLYEIVETKRKNGTIRRDRHRLNSFEMNSNGPVSFDVKESVVKDWVFVIDNFDNGPLTIDSIGVAQLNRSLIAFIDGGSPYTLKVARDLNAPVYELSYFKEKIPQNTPVVTPGPFRPVIALQKPVVDESFFTSRTWIWFGIAAVILIMGWMSWSMIKETKARDDVQP